MADKAKCCGKHETVPTTQPVDYDMGSAYTERAKLYAAAEHEPEWPFTPISTDIERAEKILKVLRDNPSSAAVELGGKIQPMPPSRAQLRAVRPGDWLASLNKQQRKEAAVHVGFFAYFPDAIALVARHSVRSNEKHNPGQPVHWARGKSADQNDCIARHTLAIAANPEAKEDGAYEIVSRAWRAMAALQEWAEQKYAAEGRID